MALSGFIKQLLETDTVFGSEAKKSTGINDASIRVFYTNVNISFILDISANTLDFVINDYEDRGVPPEWLIIDKYIKFDFIPIVENSVAHLPLLPYEERLFQISSVIHDTTLNTLTISFNPDAIGTPMFSLLKESVLGVSGLSILIDGRIFKLIGDPDIAREASNGSTMFNLDNTSSTPFQEADASGIASKYASHYHTDLVSDFVTHEKDENGNILIRVGIEKEGAVERIVYNEETAARRSVPLEVTGDNTFVTFSDGLTTPIEVAKYGRNATILTGIFVQIEDGTLPTSMGQDQPPTRADSVSFDPDHTVPQFWIWDFVRTDLSNIHLWPNPGASGDDNATAASMRALADDLNRVILSSEFTFEYVGLIGTRQTIMYSATVPGTASNIFPAVTNAGATGLRVFFDVSNVTPGTEAQPLVGTEFITTGELLTRLNDNGLEIKAEILGGVIIFSTTAVGTRVISFAQPSGDPVFENLNPGEGVVNLTLDSNSFVIVPSAPDLVYDLDGDPVFAVPAFTVRRL